MFDRVGRIRRRVSYSISQDRAISRDQRMRTTDIESGWSCFRIVLVTLDRFQVTSRSRHVIGDLDRLRTRRLSIERKRLQRYAVDRLRRINSFPRPPGLSFGLCDYQEANSARDQKKA